MSIFLVVLISLTICSAEDPEDSKIKFSADTEFCQKQFGKDQIGSWKPKYLHNLPVCKEKLVYTGIDMTQELIDLRKNLCISEGLGLIVNNCPLEDRYFRQIAKLSGLPLEGTGGRLLQLSIQRCFSTEKLYQRKYNYFELFRCIADQEKIMKGSVKLFETHKIVFG